MASLWRMNREYFLQGFWILVMSVTFSTAVSAKESATPSAALEANVQDDNFVEESATEGSPVDESDAEADLLREAELGTISLDLTDALVDSLLEIREVRARRRMGLAGAFIGVGIGVGIAGLPVIVAVVPLVAGTMMIRERHRYGPRVELGRVARRVSRVGAMNYGEARLGKEGKKGRQRRFVRGGLLLGASTVYYSASVGLGVGAGHYMLGGALMMASVGRLLHPSYEERIEMEYAEKKLALETRLDSLH